MKIFKTTFIHNFRNYLFKPINVI